MVSRGLSPICTCRHPLGSQNIPPVVRVEGWGVLCIPDQKNQQNDDGLSDM